MTPQEHQLLDAFLDRLARAGTVAKDTEADALIRQRLASQPDAAYLLVQRGLLLQCALEDAQRQIAQLQQAPAPAATESRFLSSAPEPGFGRTPSQAYMPPPVSFPPAVAGQAQPAGNWRDRLFGASAAGGAAPAAAPGGGGGFLGQAAATAAGVAGGMLLFNGLQHLGGQAAGSASRLADSAAAPGALAGTDPANSRIGEALGPHDPAAAASTASPFLADASRSAGDVPQTAADDGGDSWLADGSGFSDDDGDSAI